MASAERRSLLDVLDPNARRDLLAAARTVRVRKGQPVLARGEPAGDVFIVQEGRLHAVLYASDGREVSLRDLSVGQLFGELAVIDDEERSVGVVAVTDSRLLAIGAEAFRRTVMTNPLATDWLLRRFAAQIRGLTDKVFELSALNVRTRLYCELMRLASSMRNGTETAPSHAELANRIGTHREAVTRELGALAKRNIVRGGRRRIEFLDIAGLEREVAASLRAPVGREGWW